MIIYKLCGSTFVLMGLAYLITAIGAYSARLRVTGICCLCCLGCLNLAAIITTAVFRFNSMGKLAALSEAPVDWDFE